MLPWKPLINIDVLQIRGEFGDQKCVISLLLTSEKKLLLTWVFLMTAKCTSNWRVFFNPQKSFVSNHQNANTGKSFSEALILASTNPKYDKRLFTSSVHENWKLRTLSEHCSECQNKNKKQFVYTTCSESVLSLQFSCTELVIQWTICSHIVG